MNNPLVSIIIPIYNRAHLISETLDSIVTQTYVNWECIIVDDGSTDTTEEAVKTYVEKDSRIRFFSRPPDMKKGANSCRNYGFELSKGEFINWFDSDDIMLPQFLEHKINVLDAKVKLVISSGYYCDNSLNKIKSIELIHSKNLFKDYVLWNLHILTPSILFNKKLLESVKLFDLDILRGQETEFFSRFFFENEKFLNYKILNSHHFLYRLHQLNNSHNDKEYHSENQKSVSRIYKLNMERGFLLKDSEIVNLFYIKFISMWFRSLQNKDLENMKFIIDVLMENLKRDRWLCLKIKIIFSFSAIFGINSFRLRNYLKNIKIHV